MDITQQEKRDIEETILWLEEGAEYLDMQKDVMDGVENWKENVLGSIDTTIMWLKMLETGDNSTNNTEWFRNALKFVDKYDSDLYNDAIKYADEKEEGCI
tara:strand:- start:268 stop:567 length:300 start_codon:yes stop_codon:yes gene_type:complete